MKPLFSSVVLFCFLMAVSSAFDDLPVSGSGKAELQKLNSLIGGWRGTGQPRRGSSTGAWREDGEFIWEFKDGQPAINYVVQNGKLMSLGHISWDPDSKSYRLNLTTPENSTREYTGHWEEKQLVFLSTADGEQEVYRLSITPLNDKRTLVLHEKRKASSSSFSRLAEVGYTREGTRLATSGSGQPECIVTGGLGTMTVSYQGKTYYVCCSGCKQAFEADPAGIIAEATARLQKEKEKAAQK